MACNLRRYGRVLCCILVDGSDDSADLLFCVPASRAWAVPDLRSISLPGSLDFCPRIREHFPWHRSMAVNALEHRTWPPFLRSGHYIGNYFCLSVGLLRCV